MIFSIVYLAVRCLPGFLMVLTQRQMSKDAELLVLRHENAVITARSAQSGFGRVTWRRRTTISCRSTKISTSLEVSLRASSTTQPNNPDHEQVEEANEHDRRG